MIQSAVLIVHSGSALWSFSGPRLHQECLPRLCASDFVGGGISSKGLLAAWWSVRAACGPLRVISAHPVLAWNHPHTPAVPCEARRWRVSFHRVRTLWGGLARVCPTIQRLPVRLPDRLGGTSEFLRLPFRLKECFVFLLVSNRRYPQPCTGVPAISYASKVASSRHKAYEVLVKRHTWRRGTGANSKVSSSERTRPLSAPPLVTARGPGRLRRGWVATFSLCLSQHQQAFTLQPLCDSCPPELRWEGRLKSFGNNSCD